MPPTDDEIAAVEDGMGLHEQLIQRLADVATPAVATVRIYEHRWMGDAGARSLRPRSRPAVS
jgi:hypothetical protein